MMTSKRQQTKLRSLSWHSIYIYVNASVSCPPQAHCMPKRPHIFGFHSASNGSVCAQQLKAAAAPHLVVELEESCKGDQDVVQLHQKQASDASSSIQPVQFTGEEGRADEAGSDQSHVHAQPCKCFCKLPTTRSLHAETATYFRRPQRQ